MAEGRAKPNPGYRVAIPSSKIFLAFEHRYRIASERQGSEGGKGEEQTIG